MTFCVRITSLPKFFMRRPYYKQFGWKEGDCPVAEEYYTKCLALPMFPSLTNEEQDWVIEKVLEFVR